MGGRTQSIPITTEEVIMKEVTILAIGICLGMYIRHLKYKNVVEREEMVAKARAEGRAEAAAAAGAA
jgi:hypothetical protein